MTQGRRQGRRHSGGLQREEARPKEEAETPGALLQQIEQNRAEMEQLTYADCREREQMSSLKTPKAAILLLNLYGQICPSPIRPRNKPASSRSHLRTYKQLQEEFLVYSVGDKLRDTINDCTVSATLTITPARIIPSIHHHLKGVGSTNGRTREHQISHSVVCPNVGSGAATSAGCGNRIVHTRQSPN